MSPSCCTFRHGVDGVNFGAGHEYRSRRKGDSMSKTVTLPVEVVASHIPSGLRELGQWVLWKTVERNGQKTKCPYQPNGREAKSNDPSTWSTFEHAIEVSQNGGYDGVGFVFTGDDPYCGVDLDGCRDPETGTTASWGIRLDTSVWQLL